MAFVFAVSMSLDFILMIFVGTSAVAFRALSRSLLVAFLLFIALFLEARLLLCLGLPCSILRNLVLLERIRLML